MSKQPYQVGEGANLEIFPHGTKVGDVVCLTEAEALYERDMGRITLVEGEPLKISDEERAALPALEPLGDGPVEYAVGVSGALPEVIPEQDRLPPADGTLKIAEADGVEKTPVDPKARRIR